MQDMFDGSLTDRQLSLVYNGCGKALYTKKLEIECSRMAPSATSRSKEFVLSGS
jgi:hypothetical protein